ncbi:hypothetical protein TNCV_287261 [Trichonephila clavipes]|nr:hypothetical protein TNCV_287261 [Trichonephila clavipes]
MSISLALELNTDDFTSDRPPDRNIYSCTSAPRIAKAEMGSVGLGHLKKCYRKLLVFRSRCKAVIHYCKRKFLSGVDVSKRAGEVSKTTNTLDVRRLPVLLKWLI